MLDVLGFDSFPFSLYHLGDLALWLYPSAFLDHPIDYPDSDGLYVDPLEDDYRMGDSPNSFDQQGIGRAYRSQ